MNRQVAKEIQIANKLPPPTPISLVTKEMQRKIRCHISSISFTKLTHLRTTESKKHKHFQCWGEYKLVHFFLEGNLVTTDPSLKNAHKLGLCNFTARDPFYGSNQRRKQKRMYKSIYHQVIFNSEKLEAS